MRLRNFFRCLLILLLLAHRSAAQSPTGTISGIVTDPTGAMIASAEVIVVNDATRVQSSTKTNDEGIYVVPNLPPGNHDVVLTEGTTSHKLSLTNGPSPTIDVRLDSDRNVGSVLILTPGLDEVQVMLDGKPYKQRKKSKSGQVRINLAVKQHTIRVSKEGFQDEPEQTVDIKKGEEVTLRFQLRANPSVAVLAITGAPREPR